MVQDAVRLDQIIPEASLHGEKTHRHRLGFMINPFESELSV